MTLLSEFKHKQLLVLGAGLTGLSCVRYLAAQGLSFAVNDSRDNPFASIEELTQFNNAFPQVTLSLGHWDPSLIARADVIIISPGIDPQLAEIASNIQSHCQVIGDVELFCQLNNQRETPISMLAVTGSNGKSTVVSLLHYLAKALGINAKLGGNIGQPVLDVFTNEQVKPLPELLIVELSSFQLETLRSMHAIGATVLNVSDDHLDRHQTMANYQAIKQSIYQQTQTAITNRDDKATALLPYAKQVEREISFGTSTPEQGHFGIRFVEEEDDKKTIYLAFGEQNLIALEQLPLAGMHNALNYLAVLALGYSAGWSLPQMVNHLSGFKGLEHRCQRVMTQDNITWINDSKATNVGATLAAINGLAQTLSAPQKLVLIAGGEGKGADFSPLQNPLTHSVHQLITLGKDGNAIAKLANNAIVVSDLSEAVAVARQKVKSGDIVLLSPACASLDMFKNFVERGEQFMRIVQQTADVHLQEVTQ